MLRVRAPSVFFFFFQAEDGIRDLYVTGVQTCALPILLSGEEIFFGTGGPAARVFHSSDSGRTWTVAETPVAHGYASSGVFSISRGDEKEVVAVGGDYQDHARASGAAAYSRDKGKTWQLSAQQPGGYRSAVAHIDDGRWVAVGPNGEDISGDFGVHWKHTDSLN